MHEIVHGYTHYTKIINIKLSIMGVIINFWICVCVCMCVEREREREEKSYLYLIQYVC